MNQKYKYIFSFLLFCLGYVTNLTAQTIKHIEVSEGQPYVDHVSMVEESKDMDLLVKFIFDESQNSLTISLISYKKLFVFQDKVRYKKSKTLFHKLIPGKLPYVVQSEEMVDYKYMKPLRKSMKAQEKRIFNSWIETEGLQPQPTEYKMVNDYIEQKYDIVTKRSKVQVNLRDVLVMNERPRGKKKRYELFFQTCLNRDYEITIKRNPCFGKDEFIQAAKTRKDNVQKAYRSFVEKFGPESGPVVLEKVPIFEEMKSLLQEQYPPIHEKDSCPLIQCEVNAYNAYVDSISYLDYSYEQEMMKPILLDLEPEYILQMARKIDNAVNRWQVSTDEAEKKDLALVCNSVIEKLFTHIEEADTMNEQQAEAVDVFLKAEAYYRKNCIGNREE